MTISEPVSQQPKVQHQSNGHEVRREECIRRGPRTRCDHEFCLDALSGSLPNYLFDSRRAHSLMCYRRGSVEAEFRSTSTSNTFLAAFLQVDNGSWLRGLIRAIEPPRTWKISVMRSLRSLRTGALCCSRNSNPFFSRNSNSSSRCVPTRWKQWITAFFWRAYRLSYISELLRA